MYNQGSNNYWCMIAVSTPVLDEERRQLLLLLFCFFQDYVLKKLLTKRKVNIQMGKVQVKLILLMVHYYLFEIMGVAMFTFSYNSINIVAFRIAEYFICESTGETGCRQHLSALITNAVLLCLVLILWSLSPIMSILCKINVFNHVKSCFQKTRSKKKSVCTRTQTKIKRQRL